MHSFLLVCTLLACLLAAASAKSCSEFNSDCGDCIKQEGCGWCAGDGDGQGNHISFCVDGDTSGPAQANTCPLSKDGSDNTWRFSKSTGTTVLVNFKHSKATPTGPEGASTQTTFGDSCKSQCNLDCGSLHTCTSKIVATHKGINTYLCECKTRKVKMFGVALATFIGLTIIFCCLCAGMVYGIYYYCRSKVRQGYEHIGHAHNDNAYGATLGSARV